MARLPFNREYAVESYDPEWVERYQSESEKLRGIFGSDALKIEHVGSTSVEGMDAKSTVDILIVVEDITAGEKHAGEMESLGYTNSGAYIAENTLLFEKEVDGHRLFLVHVFEERNPHTLDMVAVRDYLSAHPDEARQYGEFKRALKAKYPNDYISYRREKDPYVAALTERARKALGS